MESAARQDPEWALAYLSEKPFSGHFYDSVRGYAESFDGRTDWRQLQGQLEEIIDGRHVGTTDPERARTNNRQLVHRVLAREWAESNLDAAIRWYADEGTGQGNYATPAGRTAAILQSVPADERYRAVDWIERNRHAEGWDDGVIVELATRIRNEQPGEDLQRLISMPVAEADRVAMLSSYATPRVRKGERSLRFPAEVLHPLIDAANLSPEAHAHWTGLVNSVGE